MSTTSIERAQRSDEQLIADVRAGDIAAFDLLYRRHAEWARGVARRHLGTSQGADDLVAEAFASVLRALTNGHGPVDHPRTYLRACLRNGAASQGRHRHGCTDVEWVDGSSYDTSDGIDDERIVGAVTIADAFKSLPARQQQALWLTAVDELSPAQAAARMGVRTETMNVLAHRARQALAVAYLDAHVASSDDPACRKVMPKLAAYARRQTAPSDTQKVAIHLEQCPTCSATLDELLDINATLRTLQPPILPVLIGGTAVGAGWLAKVAITAGVTLTAASVAVHELPNPGPTAAVEAGATAGETPVTSPADDGPSPVGAIAEQLRRSVAQAAAAAASATSRGSEQPADAAPALGDPADTVSQVAGGLPSIPPDQVGHLIDDALAGQPGADAPVDPIGDTVGQLPPTLDDTIGSTVGGVLGTVDTAVDRLTTDGVSVDAVVDTADQLVGNVNDATAGVLAPIAPVLAPVITLPPVVIPPITSVTLPSVKLPVPAPPSSGSAPAVTLPPVTLPPLTVPPLLGGLLP